MIAQGWTQQQDVGTRHRSAAELRLVRAIALGEIERAKAAFVIEQTHRLHMQHGARRQIGEIGIIAEMRVNKHPALDRQVMTMLRQLADAGRVVLVVTHSLTYLDVCDQVLLLAPGGKTAFYGPPNQIGPSMGTTNWYWVKPAGP